MVTTYHSAYSGTSQVKRRYNAIMASGDMVIANSEFTARRIVELHPEAEGRIAVIPRGIDLDDFAPHAVPPQNVQRLRAAWRVEPHCRIVLLPGRLTERKGQLVLIDAAQHLASQGYEDVRFVMAGDSRSEGFRREIEAKICRLDLTDRVLLPGYCADMPAAYLAAAVVVVPSTAPEAFGRVAVEAQAMGAPVVVSDLGAAAEIVRAPPQCSPAQSTGWRTPPSDAQALASAIAQALSLTATAWNRWRSGRATSCKAATRSKACAQPPSRSMRDCSLIASRCKSQRELSNGSERQRRRRRRSRACAKGAAPAHFSTARKSLRRRKICRRATWTRSHKFVMTRFTRATHKRNTSAAGVI